MLSIATAIRLMIMLCRKSNLEFHINGKYAYFCSMYFFLFDYNQWRRSQEFLMEVLAWVWGRILQLPEAIRDLGTKGLGA